MKIISRNNCVVCNNKLESEIFTFENFPVYMGVANHAPEKDLFANMSWFICNNCGCIQLGKLIEPDVLYYKPHNPSIGKSWQKHHGAFADFVVKNDTSGQILEIGGGNLVLQKKVEHRHTHLKTYYVLDKHMYNDNVSEVVKQVKDTFPFNKKHLIYPKTVINSHTFEHFYEPVSCLQETWNMLPFNGHLIMSIPNIANMIKDGFTNALNFEHTFWIDKTLVINMLNNEGFEVENCEDYSKYNIFISCKKTEKATVKKYTNWYKENKYLFDLFVSNKKDQVKQVENQLKDVNKNETFLFGAHVFSQFLFKFGLSENMFSAVLDNDPAKIGNRLYGTRLLVHSPKILQNLNKPLVVVKAGAYTEEIIEGIKKINSNTRFIL